MAGGSPKKTEPKGLPAGFAAQAGRGRPKGVPNKATIAAKEAIQVVFDKLGGTDAMLAWAQRDANNERVFYGTIYPKLLPLSISATGRLEIVHVPTPKTPLDAA